MAFEDRFSPNTAASPNSHNDNTRTSMNSPNSPDSSRMSPYTCLTVSQASSRNYVSSPSNSPNSYSIPKIDQERTFIRITSFALSSPRNDVYVRNQINSPQVYLRNTPSPTRSISSRTSSPPDVNEGEPTIQTLKYSITNILQPDFGKTALQKTNVNPKINFKPYEIKSAEEEKPFSSAALGNLCQAVSQIGSSKQLEATSRSSPSPNSSEEDKKDEGNVPTLWPAWVYCTRYSDRPSSGPRSRRMKKPSKPTGEDKRPRTAFSSAQLQRLKHEFNENRYLTERRRQQLSSELGLNEAQIKIWFQNKRAKIKKSSGEKNPLALQLMAQGLYNHTTVACDEDEMSLTN